METTKYQQLDLNNEVLQGQNIFKLLNKKEYDAQRYQKQKEQRKRTRDIQKHFQELGLPKPKLVNGVFGGVKKATRNRQERNRTYYLKKKQTNLFVGNTLLYLKKEIREKESDTKPTLRQSEKKQTNLYNKLKNKGGRPRSQEAQLLGRPLTNAERQKRKRLKKRLYINSKKAIINMVDNPNIRIETKNKVPTKAGRPLKGWPDWWEKLTWPQLIDKNGEAGARTGKPVKYFKRWYRELICLDGDFWKYLGLTQEEREQIHSQSIERQQKLGVGYNETTGGQQDFFLIKEPMGDLVISWGDHRPAEILRLGRQFQFEGEGKNWKENSKHPLRGAKIVKNAWGFCQIINRELKKYGVGYRVMERERLNWSKKTSSNTKIYQPSELQQKTKELLKETKTNETIILQEKILNLTERRDLKTDKWREPWIARTSGLSFFFNTYYSNQAKLLNYEGSTLRLELKRGTKQFHLNKIISVCQAV